MSDQATQAKPSHPADVAVVGGGTVTLFDLLGHSIAAAHATSAAAVAQLNVALVAFRLMQMQRDSLGADGALLEELLSGAKSGHDALSRLVRRDTGGAGTMPRTFNTGQGPGTETGAGDTLDNSAASTRGE